MRVDIARIMIFEWRILKAGRLAQFSVILLLIMIGISLITGFLFYSNQRQSVYENGVEQRELYKQLYTEISTAEHNHSDWMTPGTLQSGPLAPSAVFDRSVNFKATNPVGPLAMFNIGLLSRCPQTFSYKPAGARFAPFYRTYGVHSIGGLFPERSTDNPLLLLLGKLDLVFIILNIVPLLILALSFNIISGERESGTLAMILSNPVSLTTVIFGKLSVRFLLFLAICALLPLLIMALLTVWHNPIEITFDLFINAGLWLVSVASYIVFWLALALLVNAFNRSSSFNALMSVIAWLVFLILIPSLCNQLVNGIAPADQAYRFVTEERAASLEINAQIDTTRTALNREFSSRHIRIAGDKRSMKHYDSAYYLLPFRFPMGEAIKEYLTRLNTEWRHDNTPNQWSRALTVARHFMIEERLKSVLIDAEMAEQRQQKLSSMFRFASPAMLVRSVLDEISEVGRGKNAAFLTQLDTYIRNREESFNKTTLALRNVSSKQYEESMTFAFRKGLLAPRIKNLWFWIGGSVLFAVVALWWSYTRLNSYQEDP